MAKVTKIDRAKLSQEIDRLVWEALRQKKAPGAVVLVAYRGKVLLHRAWGWAEVTPKRRLMKIDTIFDMASLTKPLATALSAMLLLQNKRITLSDKVCRWLPIYRGGGREKITLQHLLTHTSGLTDQKLYDPKNSGVTKASDVLRAVFSSCPVTVPGVRYAYQDINYILLGKALEAAAIMDLGSFFAKNIAGKLKLRDTGFLPPLSKRDRIAATELTRRQMLCGTVHDPRSRDLGGVAGHAGLFSTALETWKLAQMILDGGGRLLNRKLCDLMTSPQTPAGQTLRGLGWEMDGPRGQLFSQQGFGHTGFTGTSVWADKKTRTVIVILTNRVHPDGKGNVIEMRRRIADAVARQALATVPARVATGIDVLKAEQFKRLRGKRIGLLTNMAAMDRTGTSVLEVFQKAKGFRLASLFSPEHGLTASEAEGASVASGRQGRLKVHSLYGRTERPTPAQLRELDALVIDLPDVGARFYTYATTMTLCMEEAAKAGLPVILLDRPNPVTGTRVEGPVLKHGTESFVGYTPGIPVRHGLTLGELARAINSMRNIGADLRVVRMRGWSRRMWYDETGLPWSNPSPNLRTLTATSLYPGVCLLEASNVSVGRGTDTPFELFGVPWIKRRGAEKMAKRLNALHLPGVRFDPVMFTPESALFMGAVCGGCRLTLLDRERFRAVLTGIAIVREMSLVLGRKFALKAMDRLLGDPPIREAIGKGKSLKQLEKMWLSDEIRFQKARKPYLLY